MRRRVQQILALALLYVASAVTGRDSDVSHGFTTIISPAAGISIVALLAFSGRLWPGVFIGAAIAKLLQGATPGIAATIAAANTCEALLTVYLLRRSGFRPALDRLRDVTMLVVVAAVVTAPLGASLVSAALVVSGVLPLSQMSDAWFARWWAHAAAALVVAPALLTWFADQSIRRKRNLEAVALSAALALAVVVVIVEPTPPWPEGSPATYLLFPMLAWSAVRFGPRGGATAVLAVAGLTTAATAQHIGPFVRPIAYHGFAGLQAFATLLGVSTMYLAAAARERENEHARAHASEFRHAATVDAAIDAIVTVDEKGRIEEVNPAAERLLGVRRAALRGRPAVDFVSTTFDDAALGMHREVRALRADGSPFDAEIAVVRLPHAYTMFIRDVTAVRDAERAILGARADLERQVSARTSELRAINERLLRRERQLAEAYALAHIGSFEWDIESGLVRGSEELYRIFGLSPELSTPTLASFLDEMAPDDRRRVHAEIEHIVARRSAFATEDRILRRDGVSVFISVRGSVVVDDEGDAISVIGTCQDVTERKLAELTQARLAAIVESSNDAIIANTSDGIVEAANDGAVRMFGYRVDEIIGRSFEILAPSELVSEHRRVFERVRRGERADAFETVGIRQDGSRFDASVQMSPVLDAAGAIVGASIVTRDITVKKKIERKMHAALREKQMLLDEVHHRVKNNLQIVSSLLHLQAASVPVGVVRRAFEDSENRIMAIALVHELLHAREGGDRVSALEYFEKLVGSLGVTCGSSAKMSVDVAPSDESLPLDAAVPCGLIVNELVSNACKHAFPDGNGGRVEVSLRRRPGSIELVVADDGVGIGRDVDWRSLRTLGLQVVLALTKQLGGTLDLDRDRARGTAFWLQFPA